MSRDPHWQRIIDDLVEHPASTWIEVTDRTGIPSPHRREDGWKKHGWHVTASLDKRADGRLYWTHTAHPPGSEVAGVSRSYQARDSDPLPTTAEGMSRAEVCPPASRPLSTAGASNPGTHSEACDCQSCAPPTQEEVTDALRKLGRTSIAGIGAEAA